MILITGATGHLGKSTIDFLLQKGFPANQLAALVRDHEKANDLKTKGLTLRIGDYNHYRQLITAFEGVRTLLFVSGSDITNRTQQHQNVVNAAKEAGVKHLLYTSFERKNETNSSPISFVAASHIATENYIHQSGINYTIFRNNLYMDLLPWFFGEKVLDTGIFLPAGQTKAALTLRDDMAEAIANVLMTEGHENKYYALSNSENISMSDVAAALSQVVGKQIAYTNPSNDEYRTSLTHANVPAELVGMFAGFSEAIQQGEFETQNADLETLLGRKATTINQYLSKVYGS